MSRPGWKEDGVAGLRMEARQMVRHYPIRKSLPQIGLCGA